MIKTLEEMLQERIGTIHSKVETAIRSYTTDYKKETNDTETDFNLKCGLCLKSKNNGELSLSKKGKQLDSIKLDNFNKIVSEVSKLIQKHK